MKELLTTYPLLVWSLISVLLAAIVIATLWEKVKWWWINTWYAFPLVGKTASLSRDNNRSVANGWTKSERALCRDYKKFIRIRDEHDFNEKVLYLTKAGDLGRHATPLLIWILTAALVFVEAMGFSYVLAGYTIPGASENLQQLGALGIAFLISVLLVAFTHFSGHELYVSGKIAQARRDWNDDSSQHPLGSGEIALNTAQTKDDHEPGYSQLANRVGLHAKYAVTLGTAAFVLIVAIGATYVRGQVLEKSLHAQTTGQDSGLQLQSDTLELSLRLPDADAQSSEQAHQQAQRDAEDIDRHGGWGTFIVLAVIFVFLQVLGVLFGYKWGFAGKQSKAAYLAIGQGRYGSYADVRLHVGEIIDAAQARLEALQQRIMSHNGGKGRREVKLEKTFKDFLHEERSEELRDRRSEQEHSLQRQSLQQQQTPAPSVIHAPSSATQAEHTASIVAPAAADLDELEQLKQALAQKQAQVQQQAQRQQEIERLKAELARLNEGGPSA